MNIEYAHNLIEVFSKYHALHRNIDAKTHVFVCTPDQIACSYKLVELDAPSLKKVVESAQLAYFSEVFFIGDPYQNGRAVDSISKVRGAEHTKQL